MKLNTLTAAIIAATAAAITSTAAFADGHANFEVQLAVTSVNNCNFTVTAENGTAMTATYKYTAADKAAGTFGTTTLDTTEPLTVLVSSGSDTCPLGNFTVATGNPGQKIAKNTAGIATHNAGVWPVRWLYTAVDGYINHAGTGAVPAETVLSAVGQTYTSSSATPDCGPFENPTVVNHTNSNQDYGTTEYKKIPAISTAPNGGHILHAGSCEEKVTNSQPIFVHAGTLPVGLKNDDPTLAAVVTIAPGEGATSVRIGLAQLLATFPYGLATKAPDPLVVFDTVNGSGVPLTGTGTMTITPL